MRSPDSRTAARQCGDWTRTAITHSAMANVFRRSCSTLTTSSTSMTGGAMPVATWCWSLPHTFWAKSCVEPTWACASVARNSSRSYPRRNRRKPWRWPNGSADASSGCPSRSPAAPFRSPPASASRHWSLANRSRRCSREPTPRCTPPRREVAIVRARRTGTGRPGRAAE